VPEASLVSEGHGDGFGAQAVCRGGRGERLWLRALALGLSRGSWARAEDPLDGAAGRLGGEDPQATSSPRTAPAAQPRNEVRSTSVH